jgi:hypothetical protein
VVFADGDGTVRTSVPVVVDPGSPLGWIDDAKVSFVKDGKLQAVDRDGKVDSDPAFSADGATVVWVDAAGPSLAMAASGGGPVLTAPLPVRSGDAEGATSNGPADGADSRSWRR